MGQEISQLLNIEILPKHQYIKSAKNNNIHSLSQYLWYWSSQTIWNIIMQLIATRSSKPSSLEEGYAGGLNPHQKRMQPPALQQTSPLPSLWDRTSCRWGPLMPAHHLSTTQGEDSSRPTQPWLSIIWGFSEDKISQTCTDLWSAFKTHEAIIDQHIFDNCQDCFAKHCNTRFLTNHNNLSLIFISTAPYPYMVTWYEQASLLPPLSIILLMFIYSHIIVADSCCNRHYLTLLTKQPCSLTT